MDCLGLLLAVVVHPADVQDRDGAKALLRRRPELPRLAVIWADGAYTAVVDWVLQQFGWIVTTILRPLGAKGYVHLPKRWIVERTFGWLSKSRRLCRDYEVRLDHSASMVRICMIRLMLRRLAKVA